MLIKDKDLKAFEFFTEKFNLKKEENKIILLKKVLKIFSEIPYENLTKIIETESKNFEKRLRTPYYIIKDFFENGGGGTCFSLVYFLKNLLQYLGFKSEFLLADRSYGENTHTLLKVEIEGEKHLCDVGYLIYKPVAIENDFFKFRTCAYDFIYENKKDGIYVYTESEKGFKKFRFKIKKEKVSEEDFISAWEKSFDFEMMNHMVISKAINDGIIYIKDNHFHEIRSGKTFYKKLEEKEVIDILERLKIKRNLIEKAKVFLK